MIDRRHWNAIICGSLLVLGTDPTSAENPSQQSDGHVKTSRAVQPMMVVEVAEGQPAAQASLGGYTRLVATFRSGLPDDPARSYDDERRSSLSRYFAGKSIGRLFSVKTTLARPRVSTVTTLASIGYTSNRKVGESWVSQIDPVRVLTPYFRIDADSAINLEATTSATSTYEMSAAAGLLDVIKRAAKLVAPTTTLVTSLNKERFEDASSFVDQSISSLLQESVTERAANDFPMKNWVGKDLVEITLWLPIANEITPNGRYAENRATQATTRSKKDQQQLKQIGTWTISSVSAILSVFSDTPLVLTAAPVQEEAGTQPAKPKKGKALAASGATTTQSQCGENKPDIQAACKAFESLDPPTVLNFQVDSGVSLAQALAGDTGIAAAREHLLQNSGKDTGKGDARALCSLVADKAQVLGFNRFDIAAILWAYASQAFVTQEAGALLQSEDNCSPLKIAYSVGLPRGGFAAKTEVKLGVVPPPAPAPLPVPPPAPPQPQS